jgi:uncharacterized protein (DUF697 family)
MNTIEKAERTVSIAAAAAAATGAVPIPFADAPLLIGEQVAMMAAIAKIFKINIQEDGLKTLAAAALGVGGATVVGKTVVSNIMKFIPGIGWFIGGVISGATAGAITNWVGMAFIELCKTIRIGKLDEESLTSKEGLATFLSYFKGFSKLWKKPVDCRSDNVGDDDPEGGGES